MKLKRINKIAERNLEHKLNGASKLKIKTLVGTLVLIVGIWGTISFFSNKQGDEAVVVEDPIDKGASLKHGSILNNRTPASDQSLAVNRVANKVYIGRNISNLDKSKITKTHRTPKIIQSKLKLQNLPFYNEWKIVHNMIAIPLKSNQGRVSSGLKNSPLGQNSSYSFILNNHKISFIQDENLKSEIRAKKVIYDSSRDAFGILSGQVIVTLLDLNQLDEIINEYDLVVDHVNTPISTVFMHARSEENQDQVYIKLKNDRRIKQANLDILEEKMKAQ